MASDPVELAWYFWDKHEVAPTPEQETGFPATVIGPRGSIEFPVVDALGDAVTLCVQRKDVEKSGMGSDLLTAVVAEGDDLHTVIMSSFDLCAVDACVSSTYIDGDEVVIVVEAAPDLNANHANFCVERVAGRPGIGKNHFLRGACMATSVVTAVQAFARGKVPNPELYTCGGLFVRLPEKKRRGSNGSKTVFLSNCRVTSRVLVTMRIKMSAPEWRTFHDPISGRHWAWNPNTHASRWLDTCVPAANMPALSGPVIFAGPDGLETETQPRDFPVTTITDFDVMATALEVPFIPPPPPLQEMHMDGHEDDSGLLCANSLFASDAYESALLASDPVSEQHVAGLTDPPVELADVADDSFVDDAYHSSLLEANGWGRGSRTAKHISIRKQYINI